MLEKPQADIDALCAIFKTSFLTSNLGPEQHLTLANSMHKRHFAIGECIIRYGDIGNEYYVMRWGTCKVTVYAEGTNPKALDLETKIKFMKTLKADPEGAEKLPMIGFGEIALLYNDKRTASITAVTEVEAWVLKGDVYKSIVAAHSINRRNIQMQYLDKISLLKGLESYEKLKLIDGLKRCTFSAGDVLIREGDEGELFYIIEKGEVECGHIGKEGEPFNRVRVLTAGESFGEVALINNVKRTMSVRSVGESEMLSLTRAAFTRILGSIKKYLKGEYADLTPSTSTATENQKTTLSTRKLTSDLE